MTDKVVVSSETVTIDAPAELVWAVLVDFAAYGEWNAFCPSIAPGTGTPSHGGFLYYEVLELLQKVAYAHEVVGIDLVEVAPDYDPMGSTAILAAQILMNLLGFIFNARQSG